MALIFNTKTKIQSLNQELEKLRQHATQVSHFLSEIEKGNLQVTLSGELLKSELGLSLQSFRNHFQKLLSEEHERNWFNTGIAQFADLLRNKESLDLANLTNQVLASLVKYVNCSHGRLYLLEEDGTNHFLKLQATYAYHQEKIVQEKIHASDGLLGQCVTDREMIYLVNIPPNYIKINSGLGEATPRAVVLYPLISNDKILGVVELASFHEMPKSYLDFIGRVSEILAGSVKNIRDNERTKALLASSQEQAEELRAQEEEMRQNMEELQATQEEIARKSRELEIAMAEMKSIMRGIDATMATIEFEPDGTIINANENFLNTIKYSLAEVKGQHHRKFVPNEIAESEDYKTFWTKLSSGVSKKGIFKRVTSNGDTVWLNAIYNPILNGKGQVTKVIKFAIDITQEQEMLAENKGILGGINETMATIEFKPDGTIISANENFLNVMKYSLSEIQGQHHRKFVPQEIRDSEEYRKFWEKLSSGESIKGVFRRVSSSGETIWLNAIYNPISNANGEVVKIIKFATDITTEQEIVSENRSVLAGINAAMATIAFKPDGTIISANENFLNTLNYSLHEIIGEHHQKFVPEEIRQSEEYKIFWKRLASGESIKGVFQRKSSTGKTVWLNAIYSPILSADGKVIKVMKFATDLTKEKGE